VLDGRVILVVGAGGLLGTAVVKALLAAGATVAATDINQDGMTRRLGDIAERKNVSLHTLDISDKTKLAAFLDAHPNLDGAVNTSYPRNKNYGAHFFDVSLDDFNENLGMHLGAHFLFMQACAARFVSAPHPFSLVNISSIYGEVTPKFDIYHNTPMTMPVEYAAIKSALVHLSKYTAAYVADSRFRVNCVSPGGLLDGQPAAFLEAYKKHTFGAGMLSEQDILGAILFLLSGHSAYINGQNIIVDDGFSI
tara:strand:- start:67127 stop:67879 length:753 start_codon:yes stop_codon:yes gene_type:complete